MGDFLDINNFDWMATDIPWREGMSECEPGNPHFAYGSGFVHDAAPACIEYMAALVTAVKAARPNIKILVYFHAFLSGEVNASSKYYDDRLLDNTGEQLCWDQTRCPESCSEFPYFYGTSTNAYGKELDAYIDKVFALGMDGIYHDESAFSVTAVGNLDFGQIIYSPNVPWDGVTVATEPTAAGGHPRVVGTPSMTPLVRLQHKMELYARVFAKGGQVVANDPPVTRTFRSWLVGQAKLYEDTGGKKGGVAIHFAETGQEVRGRVVQLYTPVMLDRCGTEGQGGPDINPKYNNTVGISAGLNIAAHLDYGVLSVMCTEPMANSSGSTNIVQWLYPITPTLLGPGTVIGADKIVTKASGSYCLGDCASTASLAAAVFDVDGMMVRQWAAVGVVAVELIDGQIAIIKPHTGSVMPHAANVQALRKKQPTPSPNANPIVIEANPIVIKANPIVIEANPIVTEANPIVIKAKMFSIAIDPTTCLATTTYTNAAMVSVPVPFMSLYNRVADARAANMDACVATELIHVTSPLEAVLRITV
jgi:hypothetical protein